jgi:hypothetical protein
MGCSGLPDDSRMRLASNSSCSPIGSSLRGAFEDRTVAPTFCWTIGRGKSTLGATKAPDPGTACKHVEIWGFSTGLAAAATAENPDEMGYIDRAGSFVIAPREGIALPFIGSIAVFRHPDGTIDYIDTKGGVIFQGSGEDTTGST